MSLTREEKQRLTAYLDSLPGKRDRDIPAMHFDRMFRVASGITLPLWGKEPTPHQMQSLWDQGVVTPQQIHEVFGRLPHPHAPNVTVADYPDYVHAHKVYQEHK